MCKIQAPHPKRFQNKGYGVGRAHQYILEDPTTDLEAKRF